MSLSEKEKQILNRYKTQGRSFTEAMSAVSDYRYKGIEDTSSPLTFAEAVDKGEINDSEGAMGFLKETAGDVVETGDALWGSLRDGGKEILEQASTETNSMGEFVESGWRTAGKMAKTVANFAGEAVVGLGKVLLPQRAEDAIKQTTQDALNSKPAQDIAGGMKFIEENIPLSDRTKENIGAGLDIAEGIGTVMGAGAVKNVSTKMLTSLERGTGTLVDYARAMPTEYRLFQNVDTGNPIEFNSVDEMFKSLDERPDYADIRKTAESTAPDVSFTEQLAGIRPDIKRRIQGKPNELQVYFDVAHARNLDDTLPTPLEVASSNVTKARNVLVEQLNDVGSDIGAFRERAGSLRASADQMTAIYDVIVGELSKLNLTVKNGQVVRKPGSVSKTDATGDITAIQELIDEYKIVKQNPTLTNLIDFRSLVDGKVNFNKRAGDASNSVDPFSRQVRKVIADQGADIVGKEQAGRLTEYSDLIDDISELNDYVERKAGGEFLLKRVLSERGGQPRQLIQRVNDRTGVDLMDDAVMARIATDIIGNSDQKGLFRQEITNAGLDVNAILRGDTVGASQRFLEWGADQMIDQEAIYMNTARGN